MASLLNQRTWSSDDTDARNSGKESGGQQVEKSLEDRYYTHWLHTNQLVTLVDPDFRTDKPRKDGGEIEASAEKPAIKARIIGVTPDLGCLIAEEESDDEIKQEIFEGGLDGPSGERQQASTKRTWYLEPDGNSFDFWSGLISRKA